MNSKIKTEIDDVLDFRLFFKCEDFPRGGNRQALHTSFLLLQSDG